MKRLFFTLAGIIIAATMMAQAPNTVKYQAVARDNAGDVIANQSVSLTISILQGSVTGTEVFTETHDSTTNAYGLVSLNIGAGNPTDFANIDWSSGPYFVKVVMDGNEMGTSQLLSVPYAKYADEAGNVFSGNYNDLTGTPDLSDTANYLTTETDPEYSGSVASGITSADTANWNAASSGTVSGNETTFDNWDKDATDDFDGNYGSLNGTPTNVSSFTNDAGYLTQDTTLDESEVDAMVSNNGYAMQAGLNDSIANLKGDLATIATSGSYNDLTDVPANLDTDASDDFDGNYSSLSGAPTNVSSFTNDAGYLTQDTTLDESEVDAMVSNNGYAMQAGLNDSIANLKGDLATIATSGSYNDLTDVPANLDTDASDDFDGNYSSLSGAPTNVSSFTNDAGYLTQDTTLDESEVDAMVSNNGYLTSEVDGSITNEIELPTQTGNSGKILTTDGSTPSWTNPSSTVVTYKSYSGATYSGKPGSFLPDKVGDLTTFSTTSTTSDLVINIGGIFKVTGNTTTNVNILVYLDGTDDFGTNFFIFPQDEGNLVDKDITVLFDNVSSGSHTLSIYAKTSDVGVTEVKYLGNTYGNSRIIIQEIPK